MALIVVGLQQKISLKISASVWITRNLIPTCIATIHQMCYDKNLLCKHTMWNWDTICMKIKIFWKDVSFDSSHIAQITYLYLDNCSALYSHAEVNT